MGSRTNPREASLRPRKTVTILGQMEGLLSGHDQWIYKENMAADDLIKIYERENRSDEEVRPTSDSWKQGLGQQRWTLTVPTSHLPGSH